jgi:hypothetical protein
LLINSSSAIIVNEGPNDTSFIAQSYKNHFATSVTVHGTRFLERLASFFFLVCLQDTTKFPPETCITLKSPAAHRLLGRLNFFLCHLMQSLSTTSDSSSAVRNCGIEICTATFTSHHILSRVYLFVCAPLTWPQSSLGPRNLFRSLVLFFVDIASLPSYLEDLRSCRRMQLLSGIRFGPTPVHNAPDQKFLSDSSCWRIVPLIVL